MIRGFVKTSLVLLLLSGLSACSLFSSDEEVVVKPRTLQDLKKTEIQLTEVWSKTIGKGVGSGYATLRPAIDNNVIYVAGAEGTVFALDATTGKVKWKVDLGVPVGGGVTVSAQKVLLGTLNGEVIALNQDNGSVLWKARVSSEVLSVPVIDNNFVIVKSLDDQVTALNATTGKRVWDHSVLQPPLTLRAASAPAIAAHSAVIAGYTNGNVSALNLKDGSLLWNTKIAIPEGSTDLERMVDVDTTPLIVGDTIFTASYQGNVVALDLYSGRERWSKPFSTYHALAQGFGSIYITAQNGFVSSLDQLSGAANWRQEGLEARTVSAPATFNNYVVVGDYQGYIHLLSQVDGSFAGRYKTGSSSIKAQPLVMDNMLYVFNSDGKLIALKKR
ncbi:MAG: outer membrane protein assembly factor BamB [Endozoicomonas sp. (ex Botrylloides leachii)]|nr:outer membrane protein assembly factor BamB [Endozoicomonas sp. (ex Botrylloides leachii)]